MIDNESVDDALVTVMVLSKGIGNNRIIRFIVKLIRKDADQEKQCFAPKY